MGALSFIRSFFGGNPREVVKLGKGGTGAVNPPTIVEITQPDGVKDYLKETYKVDKSGNKKLVKKEWITPKFCNDTYTMISRKKGATVSEIMQRTGKTKGTIYQEISLLKKNGVKFVRTYEKPAFRFRVK